MPRTYEQAISRTVAGRRAFSPMGGLLKIMTGVFLLLAPIQVFSLTLPTSRVTLAWDGNPDSDGIAGYRIHYGIASRIYTSSITVENSTSGTVSGLMAGLTYYFAVTAYDVNGYESDFSEEIVYTPELPIAQFTIDLFRKLLTLQGVPNRTYDVWAKRNLTDWAIIGRVTTQADGSATFSDPNMALLSVSFYLPLETPPSVQIRKVFNGEVIMTVIGQAGHLYEIEATQDFVNWTVIGQVTVEADGSSDYIDSTAGEHSARMYRTRDVNY
jgi:hypothetical protein